MEVRSMCVILAVVFQLLSRVQLFANTWTAARQASLSFTISQSLLKLTAIEPVMPSKHLFLRHPLLLLPSVFPRIRVFSKESALSIRWPKYWISSFSISPSNSGLVSFRIDWIGLLALAGRFFTAVPLGQQYLVAPALLSQDLM